MSEHWLTREEVDGFTPQGNLPAKFYCRETRKNRVAGIFVKQGIEFAENNLSGLSSVFDCELSCIKLLNQNITIVSLYRAPQGNLETFFLKFELVMENVLTGGALAAICGDFNIEMLSCSSQTSLTYNLLKSFNLTCAIQTPTRFNSCN